MQFLKTKTQINFAWDGGVVLPKEPICPDQSEITVKSYWFRSLFPFLVWSLGNGENISVLRTCATVTLLRFTLILCICGKTFLACPKCYLTFKLVGNEMKTFQVLFLTVSLSTCSLWLFKLCQIDKFFIKRILGFSCLNARVCCQYNLINYGKGKPGKPEYY